MAASFEQSIPEIISPRVIADKLILWYLLYRQVINGAHLEKCVICATSMSRSERLTRLVPSSPQMQQGTFSNRTYHQSLWPCDNLCTGLGLAVDVASGTPSAVELIITLALALRLGFGVRTFCVKNSKGAVVTLPRSASAHYRRARTARRLPLQRSTRDDGLARRACITLPIGPTAMLSLSLSLGQDWR